MQLTMTPPPVIPAKAGIQRDNQQGYWIPAFAGMTSVGKMAPKSLQFCSSKDHEYISGCIKMPELRKSEQLFSQLDMRRLRTIHQDWHMLWLF